MTSDALTRSNIRDKIRDNFRDNIRMHPRVAAAVAFGVSTLLVTHFAWHADARMDGAIPAITLGAGAAHAFAGAITGRRLLDTTKTRTPSQATLLGAITSLCAAILFAPCMALYVSSGNTAHTTIGNFVTLTFFTGLFAFFAVGWALMLVSVIVAYALHSQVPPVS